MSKRVHILLLGSAISFAAVFAPMPIGLAQAQEAGSIIDYVAADDPPAFDDPSKAVEAFKSALAANDFDGLAKLLGLDAAKLKAAEGAMETFALIREGAARNVVMRDLDERKVLEIGDRLWPLPFPIAKGEDG